MTTISVNTAPARTERAAVPTVSIAGVDWPLYKLQAVVVGILLALTVGLATGSAEPAAWALTLGTAGVWWLHRVVHARRADR